MLITDCECHKMPKHVAIIMDGNGRWAGKQGKPRVFGHQKALKAVRKTIDFALTRGIKMLTLYAFSQENWSRPQDEVDFLIKLFTSVLNRHGQELVKKDICVKFVGDLSAFQEKMQLRLQEVEEQSANNQSLMLNIALNYSSRWEIVEAVKKTCEATYNNELGDESIEQRFQRFLAIEQDVDLLIRTSGEMRLSNFLLWQCAYAEFYFTDVLWPDFDETVFSDALSQFQLRHRRFGGL